MIASGVLRNLPERVMLESRDVGVMTRNQRNIVAAAVGAAICAGVFVVSLLYQFGLLEGVSCLAAWAQLYLLCETAVDAREDRQATSGKGLVASVVVAAWLGADLLRGRRGF